MKSWPIDQFRLIVPLLFFVWGGATAQVTEPAWVEVWPNDTGSVVVGDTLNLEWTRPTGQAVSHEMRDLILLRTDPWALDSVVDQDVRLKLRIKATQNPDHGDYQQSADKDTLFFVDLKVAMRGADLYPVGLDSALATLDAAAFAFGDAHKVQVILDSVLVDQGNGWQAKSFMPHGLVLELEITWSEIAMDGLNAIPSGLSADLYDCYGQATLATAQELEFSWSPMANMEAYDLEWTWVDNYRDLSGSWDNGMPMADIDYDFKRDATRVTIPADQGSLYYRIPLIYDHGYIIWRVRGAMHSSGNAQAWVFTDWSIVPESGNVQAAFDADANFVREIPSHQGRKNWQVSRSYAEEGKHKEVVTYADGSLRTRQVVTRNNTLGAPIVGETVYDATGRASVQIMPVPSMREGCVSIGEDNWAPIDYKPDFNQEDSIGGSKPFTWADLTGDECAIAGPQLDSISGAQYYYSGAYAEEDDPVLVKAPSFLPRAEGRPYSQTEYTRDNTGRIRSQGGVGPEFQLGAHDTKYYYGVPLPIELDRLFGSEAGYASHYQKNVTVDPNNQVSVTYVDMAGRTVATALACGSPDTMDPLEGNVPVELTNDLFGGLASTDSSAQMRQDGPALMFTTQFAVACVGEYDLNYSLDTKTIAADCAALCAHCVYELTIQLTDQCGTSIVLEDASHNVLFTDPIIIGSLDEEGEYLTDCEGQPYPDGGVEIIPVTLDQGEYTLTKILRIHAPARDHYVEIFLDPEVSTCIKDSADFAQDALAAIDSSGCNQTCEECYASLGTLDDFMGQAGEGHTADEYWALRAECDETCKVKSWCDVAYENMISDMMPNSQYGMIEYGPDGIGGSLIYTAPDPTSIFHGSVTNLLMTPLALANSTEPWRQIDTGQPAWRQPLMETETGWQEGYYTEGERFRIQVYEDGAGGFTPEVIEDSEWDGEEPGTYFVWPEDLLNFNDFMVRWQPGWERSLVRFHPEYCYYRDCKGYGELSDSEEIYSSSDGFDARLNMSITYDDAVNDQLLDGSEFNYDQDPFIIVGGQYAQALQDKVDVYISVNGNDYTMLQVAAATAKCAGNLNGGNNCLTFCDANDGVDSQNAQWATLKGFYRSEKYRIQKHKADAFVSNCGCGGLNVCIGEEETNTWVQRTHNYPIMTFEDWGDMPAHQGCQPCNDWNYAYFSDKVRRVPEPDMIGPVNSAMDAAYQVFLQTGQCPVGTAWQSVFQQLFTQVDFDPSGTYDLNDYPSWLGVYMALNDLDPVATAPEAHAVFSQSGSVLNMLVDFDDPTASDCSMTLTLPDNLQWSDDFQITYVAQLNAVNGAGNFQLGLYYTAEDGSTGNIYLDGTGMCHALAPCNFPPDCEPNELGLRFEELLNMMVASGQLVGNTPLATTLLPPGGSNAPTVQSQLGQPITSHFPPSVPLRWKYESGNQRFILQNDNAPNSRFRLDQLTISDPEPGSLTLAQCLADAAYFQNMNSAFTNNFTVDVYDASDNLKAHLSGKVWFDEGAEATPMPFGSCGLPPSVNCEGGDYETTRDLMAVLGPWVLDHGADLVGASLWDSPMMTPNLALALCPSCEEIGENMTAVAVSPNTVRIGDCMEVNVQLNSGQSNFNSAGSISFTDSEEGSEVWHGLSFALYNNGQVVGNVQVLATCVDLVQCGQCPMNTTPPDGSAPDGTVLTQAGVSELAMMSDAELYEQGFLHLDSLYADYVRYKQAIDSLNTRMGLAPYDSAYVEAVSYAGYRKEGMQHAVKVYLGYIRNFRPELDRSLLLKHSGKFVAEYGNAVNVEEEYNRYIKVVEDYNLRADSAGKPNMELLPDSIFRKKLYADKAALYVANLVDMPPLDNPPLDMEGFFDLYGDSSYHDACSDLYRYSYLPAYKWLESRSGDSTARCPDYRKFSPLASMEEFMESNLCCSDTGQAVLTAYLRQFYNDTLKCPGALPRLKDCPDPLETVQKVVEKECQGLYSLWVEAMKDYKESLYGSTQGYPLPFDDISFQVFMKEKWCDCVRDYLRYLQPWLSWDGDSPKPSPPLHIADFCSKPCKDSYKDWLGLMEQYNHPCAYAEESGNYLPIEDLEDYGNFMSAQLCNCVEAYNAYIHAYVNWDGTPLPAPQSIVDFCSEDSLDCRTLVDSLKRILVEAYVESDYYVHFQIELPFEWTGWEDINKRGLCECLPAYLEYLADYLGWPETGELEPVLSLDEFCNDAPTGSPCANSFAVYTQGWQALMPLVDAANEAWPGSNYHFDLADESLFTAADLCYCVEAYLADAELALTQAIATEDQTLLDVTVFSILRHCETPQPCPPPPLFPITPTVTITEPECLCCEQLEAGAIGDADIQYQQYLDTLVNDLTARYDSACLTALEHFSVTAPNSEYHYTLYYYDQAGNLVRTVPPAGVQPLGITSMTDAKAVRIQEDRANGTHTVVTKHRMASDHLYNSLEQPTHTFMPDQDPMPIWETALTSGLPDFLQITGSWFGDGGIGYLSGYREMSNNVTRGYAYRTMDGGRSWQRSTGLLGADLNDVHFPVATRGYAVGTHGAFLRSLDGGISWDLLPNELLGEGHELTALAFRTAANGLVLGSSGYWGLTTNQGGTFSSLTSMAGAPDFTGAGFDGLNYQASASAYENLPNGAALALPQGGTSWDNSGAFGSVAADLACAAAFGPDTVRVGGSNGVLIENNAPATDQWRMLPTGTADGFRAFTFLNGERGIAIMDSSDTGIGVLRYTMDNGKHWLPIGLPAFDLNAMAEYERDDDTQTVKVVAVGKTGTVVRVILSSDNVGIIPMTGMANTELTAVWTETTGEQVRCLVGTVDGHVLGTTELGPGQQATWTELASLGSSETIQMIAGREDANVIYAVALTGSVRSDLKWEHAVEPPQFLHEEAEDHSVSGWVDAGGNAFLYDPALGHLQKHELADLPPYNPISVNAAGTTPTQAPAAMLNTGGMTWATGGQGALFNITGIGPYTWADHSGVIRPLPLNAMDKSGQIAVGDQGLVYKKTANGWRSVPTGHIATLNAVSSDDGTIAVAGDAGTAFTFDLSDPTDLHEMEVPVSSDLHAVAVHGAQLTLGGEAGLALYTANHAATPPAFTVMPFNAGTLRAFGYNASLSGPMAVGDGALVNAFVGSNRSVVNDVFTPRLNDVDFANGSNGYVVGDNQTVRHTSDGGLHWHTVPMPPQSVAPVKAFRAVKSTGADTALAVGDLGVNAQFTGTAWAGIADFPNTTDDLQGIAVAPSEAAVVVGEENSSTDGVYFRRDAGADPWTTASTANHPLYAVWNFPRIDGKDEFIVGGRAGFARRLLFPGGVHTGEVQEDIANAGDIRAFWFHDHVAGFAATDGNELYRTAVTTTPDHAAFDWQDAALAMNDGLDGAGQSDWRPTTMGFSDRHHGFIGGSYATGTPKRYARTLTDETGLYSQRFWYDALGRIVLSQNSKQFDQNPKRYSYSLYDDLGRVYEAGEVDDDDDSFKNIAGTVVGGAEQPSVLSPTAVKDWVGLHGPAHRRAVTRTWYDQPIPGLSVPDFDQDNLRLRVASTTFQETYDSDPLTYDHATHYSYDIHGNVKCLMQDMPRMGIDGGQDPQYVNQRWKRIDYRYDLVSGNVLGVDYQQGFSDQMHHRYKYDADNRITVVETSADKTIWHTDAEYFYYPHGPLERVEYGDSKVQGMDYAYTLQGWLKAINSDRLVPTNDMGRDGLGAPDNPNSMVGRDAYGESIGYFGDEDYQAIDPLRWDNGNGTRPVAPVGDLGSIATGYSPLHNGNIAHTVNSLQPFTGGWSSPAQQGQVLAQVYRYDQLNRLKQARGVEGLTASNTWDNVTDPLDLRYQSNYDYDANGNILRAQRYGNVDADADGQADQYDDLGYHYEEAAGKLLRNRLYNLNESIDGGYGDIGIDDSDFHPDHDEVNLLNNYRYDELGNLIQDRREEIADIEWTVAGKVKHITRTSGSTRPELAFTYGADGQRTSKAVGDPDNGGFRNYYIRDAQGNIMATYLYKSVGGNYATMLLGEQPIYGSKRVGSYAESREMIATLPAGANYTHPMQPAHTRYELTDHLGNVAAVVSGRLLPMIGPGQQFQAELLSAQGYEAGGSLLPGRNYSSNSYTFGFNGMPKDDEIYGAEGTSYDFGARLLDPRVGRWMSVDPVVQRYPGYSPYAYVLNSPLLYRDEGGKENFIYLYDLRLQNPKLTQADRTEIMKQANEIASYANSGFVAKGLTPRVIAIGFVPSAGALDPSDMLATIGTAQQTFDFDNSSYVFKFDGGYPDKRANADQYDVGATVKDVRGWAVNGESTSKGSGMKGNRIALNEVLINDEAGSFDKTPAQYAGWLLQHEAGHAAGIMHSDELNKYNAPQSDRKEDLMTSGDYMMKDVSRAPSYMDIVSPYLNGLFSNKFTSNPARINLGRSTSGEGLGPKPMPK